jgi:hypothetical protein
MFPNFNCGQSPFYTFAIQNFPFIERDFDALTDYQLMCKIFKYLDDEIKKVDEKYSGIADLVENIDEQFENFKTDVNKIIEDFEKQVYIDMNKEFNVQYSKILNLLAEYKITFEAYVDSNIDIVNKRIDDIEIGAISIYNPLSGTIEPINKVIDDVYNSLRYNAITCSEYDSLELTALGFDDYLLTAQNFDLNAKSIFMG